MMMTATAVTTRSLLLGEDLESEITHSLPSIRQLFRLGNCSLRYDEEEARLSTDENALLANLVFVSLVPDQMHINEDVMDFVASRFCSLERAGRLYSDLVTMLETLVELWPDLTQATLSPLNIAGQNLQKLLSAKAECYLPKRVLALEKSLKFHQLIKRSENSKVVVRKIRTFEAPMLRASIEKNRLYIEGFVDAERHPFWHNLVFAAAANNNVQLHGESIYWMEDSGSAAAAVVVVRCKSMIDDLVLKTLDDGSLSGLQTKAAKRKNLAEKTLPGGAFFCSGGGTHFLYIARWASNDKKDELIVARYQVAQDRWLEEMSFPVQQRQDDGTVTISKDDNFVFVSQNLIGTFKNKQTRSVATVGSRQREFWLSSRLVETIDRLSDPTESKEEENDSSLQSVSGSINFFWLME